MNYSSFKQGEIISAPIPFSNQIEAKVRPALVISRESYNDSSEDIVILKITSKGGAYPFDVAITPNDLELGQLKYESIIQTDFPVVIEKRSVVQTIGKLSSEKLTRVKQKIREFYEL